jgi:Domain of Unknown Function (DUF928)
MRHSNLTIASWAMLITLAIPAQACRAVSSELRSVLIVPPPASKLISQRPPAPPRNPPPNGSRPGGGLNSAARSACTSGNTFMQALVPVQNPVLTTTNQPTILIYIPFGSDQVQFGEFSLLPWPGEQQRIYSARFTLPKTPGIVSVTLPSRPEYALKQGDYYHWYFQLYCRDGNGKQPDLTVHGLIQRTALTAERERQISAATPDVWYDALARVAAQLQTSPQNSNLRNQWRTLLRTIGAEDLAEEPLLGPVIPLKTPSP